MTNCSKLVWVVAILFFTLTAWPQAVKDVQASPIRPGNATFLVGDLDGLHTTYRVEVSPEGNWKFAKEKTEANTNAGWMPNNPQTERRAAGRTVNAVDPFKAPEVFGGYVIKGEMTREGTKPGGTAMWEVDLDKFYVMATHPLGNEKFHITIPYGSDTNFEAVGGDSNTGWRISPLLEGGGGNIPADLANGTRRGKTISIGTQGLDESNTIGHGRYKVIATTAAGDVKDQMFLTIEREWDYIFIGEGVGGGQYGDIIARALVDNASLDNLAQFWDFGRNTKKSRIVVGRARTGAKVTSSTQVKKDDHFNVFYVMPEFYQEYVGTEGGGNCGNAALSYVGMYERSMWGKLTLAKDDMPLWNKLASGKSECAGSVGLFFRQADNEDVSMEPIHFYIILADGWIFEKDSPGNPKYELRKGSRTNYSALHDHTIRHRSY